MVDLEQTAMTLIVHAGNARSLAYEAFEVAATGDFVAAALKLKEATAEIGLAHAEQTAMIQAEAAGRGAPLTLLMVHAQDHLMTAMTEVNLIERLIRMLEIKR